MVQIAKILSLLVVALHILFAIAEILFWQHPTVMQRFGSSAEFAKASAVLASNQGIYNVLLALSLGWAVVRSNAEMWRAMLWFAAAAGLYGALTFKPTIFFVQSLPALLALAAFWMSKRDAI